MGQDASALKQQIAQTRERMGDTVEALAYKADVPTRIKDSVQDRADNVKGVIGDMMESVKTAVAGASSNVNGAVGAGAHSLGNGLQAANARLEDADVGGNARRAVGAVQENPIGLALAALAVGFLTGSVIPVSETERRRLTPIGRKLASQAQAATSDLIDAGKAVAVETAQVAVAAALSSAKSHGQEVVDAAKARAGDPATAP